MSPSTQKILAVIVITDCLQSGGGAAGPLQEVAGHEPNARWTLSTADTQIKFSVSGNKLYIDSLKNPTRNWNWVPEVSEIPLPGKDCIRTAGTDAKNESAAPAPNWAYVGSIEDEKDGHRVTFRFASTTPALELKSVWSARPGPGPVENQTTIENKSGGEVIYNPAIAAGAVRLKADGNVRLWSFEKTDVGPGHFSNDWIGPGTRRSIDSRQIPFIMLDVGSAHGAYIGYEWELGVIQIASGSNPLDLAVSVLPITEPVTQKANEVFSLPNVYYGAYPGDADDGGNRFKRWFWNHKITRSLHDNVDEPWTEVCMQTLGGNGSASVTGATPQSAYDTLAATGVECVKFDFWDGSGKCWYSNRDWMFHPEVWPNGFDYAAKAHKAGLAIRYCYSRLQ